MLKHTSFMGSGALRAMAVAGALAAPIASNAGEVSLKSVDGTVDLVGEFIGFENNTYIISTVLGELRVSAERVTCSGADCPTFDTQGADFTVAGSNAFGEGLMPLLLEGWAASRDAEATMINTQVSGQVLAEFVGDQGFGDQLETVQVSSTTSGDAFRTLLEGRADIGMAARPISVDEARVLRAAGAGNMVDPSQQHIIAVDSVLVVTHNSNPVESLTTDQLRGIFAGQITNWSQVGGEDKAINVVNYAEGTTNHDYFMSYLYGDDKPSYLPDAIAADDQVASNVVFQDQYAIGYVGYAFQRGAKAMTLINECGLEMTPDSFAARTEEYSLQRRMYLYNVAGGLNSASREFIDYALSDQADAMIEKSGFISLGIASQVQDFESPRAQALLAQASDPFEGAKMREMLGTMVGYDRLSSTFRFDLGSSQLNERAVFDMARLVDYLEDMPRGTKVMFVGFTDDIGTFQNNQVLSERRSAQVLETMRAFAGTRLPGIQLASTGFGEVAPSACNIDDTGRQINRRVEVWISAPDA